jgi:hypothetical protein
MSAANELELESEFELESEGEFELAGELEQELGLAHELANEFELEHEQEAEHEAFFNNLAAMADRSGRSQALRRIALAAARSALKGQARPWPVVQGEGELGELEGEFGELEAAHEFEFEASSRQLAHLAAEMEHEGHAAAEAANEQEAAEHFLPLIGLAAKFVLPKLAGLAAKKLGGMAAKKIGGKLIGRVGGQLLRKIGPRVMNRVTPQLTRGVANVTRTLFQNRATRPLIHAVPRIARTTVARIGRQIASGQRVTPQQALRTLAQQTARTVGNPRALAQTYRRSLALDQRYHRRTRRVLGRPAGAPVRAAHDPGSPAAGAAFPGAFPAGVMPGYGGVPAPASGGCRCNCQPFGGAMPSIPMMAMPQVMPMPQSVPTCPTCGR